jgi:hypothetical protein
MSDAHSGGATDAGTPSTVAGRGAGSAATQSFERGLTVGFEVVLGREGRALGRLLGADGRALGLLGAEGRGLGRDGADGRTVGRDWTEGRVLGRVDDVEGRVLGRVDGAEGRVLGRVDGTEGRVLGRVGVGAGRVLVPERPLGVGVARPEGRGVAPELGDDGRAGLTMRGSCAPRLGADGEVLPDEGGGVRTGSLELGVVGRRCSVGRGDGSPELGRGEALRAAADGAIVPGGSL